MKTTAITRTAAFVAAFGITFAPVATQVAFAQTTAPAPVDYNSIDWTQDGKASLQIVKKLLASGEAAGEKANGETMDPTPGTVLPGVTFKLELVTNADLTTDAGWAAASQIANGQAPATLGTGVEVTTDTNGVANFTNLKLGLYKVTETVVPDGVVPSKPFYVFVPMTSASSDAGAVTTWNYNPVVYPKNTENKVVKTVQDADQNVGDSITYTITSDIPALADATTNLSKYIVQDDLDEEQLTTTADQVTLALSNGTALVAGTDYNVTVDPATQQVVATLTDAGLVKLTEAKRADAAVQVVTTVTAKVSAIGASDGVVKNDAQTITNNGGGAGDTTTDSNEVTTKWGKLIIDKEDEAGTKLAGATFEVYQCNADAQLIGDKLTIDGQTEWTTDATGAITIDGLHVTDIENSDQQIDKFYCLVETKAPAGYAKLVEPVQFQMENSDPEAVNISYTAEVINVDDDDFLPSTGGMGVGLIIAAGAGIIGAGAYAARRNAKA